VKIAELLRAELAAEGVAEAVVRRVIAGSGATSRLPLRSGRGLKNRIFETVALLS
jgi:hypothetical protein